MKRTITYAPQPAAELDSILLYSLREWGPAVAREYLDGLEATIEMLARFPRRGRQVGQRRRYRFERHIVYYRTTSTKLEVLLIVHEKRAPERHQ